MIGKLIIFCVMAIMIQRSLPLFYSGRYNAKGEPLNNFLNPSKVKFDNLSGLQLNFTNVHIYEQSPKLSSATLDFKNKNMVLVLFNPYTEYDGKYSINGKFDSKQVYGKGLANATFENSTVTFEARYEIKNSALHVYQPNVTSFEIDKLTFTFHNLFNGNKTKGYLMNTYLDKNWKDLWNELKPSFSKFLAVTFMNIINNFTKFFPFFFLLRPILCQFTLFCI